MWLFNRVTYLGLTIAIAWTRKTIQCDFHTVLIALYPLVWRFLWLDISCIKNCMFVSVKRSFNGWFPSLKPAVTYSLRWMKLLKKKTARFSRLAFPTCCQDRWTDSYETTARKCYQARLLPCLRTFSGTNFILTSIRFFFIIWRNINRKMGHFRVKLSITKKSRFMRVGLINVTSSFITSVTCVI